MEDLRISWEEQVDSARFQMDFADSQEDRILSGQTSAQEARQEAYDAAVQQQEAVMKAAEDNLEALKKAVEQAQWQTEMAQREDSASAMTQEQKNRLSALALKGLENTRRDKEKELAFLEELMAEGGQVQAAECGVAVDVEVTAGRTATGEELVTVAVGGGRFQGTFEKEEQKLSRGDTISIAIPGKRPIMLSTGF